MKTLITYSLAAIAIIFGVCLLFKKKKPNYGENTGDPYCPTCGVNIYHHWYEKKCPACGQRLDWSEE